MSRNSRRPPAVQPPVRNSQLLPSKSKLKKFNAPPLFGMVDISHVKTHRFLRGAILAGRSRVEHLEWVSATNGPRDHAVHIYFFGNRRRRPGARLRVGDRGGKGFRDNRGNGGSDQQGGDEVGLHGVAADGNVVRIEVS